MLQQFNAIETHLNQVILGKPQQIKLALCCLLAKGHLLLEDLPGMGKTTLAHALANSLSLSYRRVQFTSDLLPGDLLGMTIYDTRSHQFSFKPGPVFSHLLLADEINRASPKTQSALLEAMEEQQVSIDGETHALPKPFFVIATQNPLDQSGTSALPESQLDRFLMRVSLGFPSRAAEFELLDSDRGQSRLELLSDTLSIEQLMHLQQQVPNVTAAEPLLHYILDLVGHSRQHPDMLPLSPRAAKALLQAAKSWALLHQRNYVTAEDVQAVFPSVAEHRLAPKSHAADARWSALLLKETPCQL
ncbi:AAA family ATPase [Alkalimonas collagenimarina]|uniref:AAA family ATPase n=1 Tax=Alkalimonas collagenimarina TaxID=400390 RepID=A0ABT9H2A8_9GAMM|nr:AAA family ATPase [Alkalimonas collagenimarina]MDP4537427.1 AAA family ATPase [Alkalimonas collagenimarina]